MASNILAWDAIEKLYHGQPGDVSAPFIFNFTNVSSGALVIYDTHTSCECTVAKLPTRPWTLASGGAGQLSASIDLSNKFGFVTNEIIVFTSQGNRRLKVEASIAK